METGTGTRPGGKAGTGAGADADADAGEEHQKQDRHHHQGNLEKRTHTVTHLFLGNLSRRIIISNISRGRGTLKEMG